MPKRASHLWEQATTDENCIAAVCDMLKGKRGRAVYASLYTKKKPEARQIIIGRLKRAIKRERVQYFRDNAERIGREIADELREGRWEPKPYRERMIYDGLRGKVRRIRVPCLHDQVVHHAVMRVTAPEIMRRNDWHNCGSIPKAGQTRAVNALRRLMAGHNPPRYALVMDVRKFYDTCPHPTVMVALRGIIKDRRFLALHEQMLKSMGDGLAIGFYPSQWYANLVLAPIDRAARRQGISWVRYMDDMIGTGNNKRILHRFRKTVQDMLNAIGLTLKRTWQVIRIAARGLAFLSYRFYAGRTVLRKPLMYRIARIMRRAAERLTPHRAMAVMSYLGILRQCDSYHFRQKWVYPFIDVKKCKGVIRYVQAISRVLRAAVASGNIQAC